VVVDADGAVHARALGLDGDQHIGLAQALAGLDGRGGLKAGQVAQQQNGFVERIFGDGVAGLQLASHNLDQMPGVRLIRKK